MNSTEVHRLTEEFLMNEQHPTVEADEAFGTGLPAGGRKPYAGTSGRGGSQASADQRALEDATGITGARQHAVISALGNAGAMGLTWRELAAKEGWHHGQATGALSTLHKAGDIVRLATVKRGRSSVYVLKQFVDSRAVARHGGKTTAGALNLTTAQISLIEAFETRAKGQPSDKPMVISAGSAKALAAILKMALGEVR